MESCLDSLGSLASSVADFILLRLSVDFYCRLSFEAALELSLLRPVMNTVSVFSVFLAGALLGDTGVIVPDPYLVTDATF